MTETLRRYFLYRKVFTRATPATCWALACQRS
jgi:hypothetical protein